MLRSGTFWRVALVLLALSGETARAGWGLGLRGGHHHTGVMVSAPEAGDFCEGCTPCLNWEPCADCGSRLEPFVPVTTTYTTGVALRSIRFGIKPEVGPLTGNTSGLVVGDVILAVDGMKATSNEVLGEAIDKAKKEKRPVRLVVLDEKTRKPFVLDLDVSGEKQMVRETEVVPVNLTVSEYYVGRPGF